MFFGILQPYIIDIYEFYFEEYMHGYLAGNLNAGCNQMQCERHQLRNRRYTNPYVR